MSRLLTRLYVHLVWATWQRLPLITPILEPQLYSAIGAKCAALGCKVIALGGYVDHVHLLVRMPPTIAVASLVKEIKGSSSHLIAHESTTADFFKWQGSYGAFTVGRDGLRTLASYIKNQKAHHEDNSLTVSWEQMEESGT